METKYFIDIRICIKITDMRLMISKFSPSAMEVFYLLFLPPSSFPKMIFHLPIRSHWDIHVPHTT